MSQRKSNILVGVALILLGGLFALQTFELVPDLSMSIWAAGFGAVGLLFLLAYFATGGRNWPLLFPALIPLAIGGVFLLLEVDAAGSVIGALFMTSIALPFWVAFLVETRANWWALIPGWVLTVIALISLLSDVVNGDLLGALLLFSVGLPFFVLFLVNRKHWWALLPAGILFTVGAMALLATTPLETVWDGRAMGALFFMGLAVPFGLLWMLRDSYPTRWAAIPALALALFGAGILAYGDLVQKLWPVTVILVGLWMLYRASRGGRSPGKPAIK